MAGRNGSTETTDYLKAFAGSTGNNAIDDYAVYGDIDGTTRPVGSNLPNEPGLDDKSGTLEELMWDRWAIIPPGR